MDWLAAALLLVAGMATGVIGYGAGLASLVSFPALLATGLAPLAANVSNTIALTCSALGGLLTAGPELRPQRTRVIGFALAGAGGGVVGALLLLTTPNEVFARVVPWLVGFASIALLARPWLRTRRFDRLGRHRRAVFLVVAGIAVYGGYFGAAAGVLLLAMFGALFPDPYAMVNALKSVVLGAANVAASLVFVCFTPIAWQAVIPLAIGCLVGSAVAPPIVRRLPEGPLRIVVGLSGLALAVRLYVTA